MIEPFQTVTIESPITSSSRRRQSSGVKIARSTPAQQKLIYLRDDDTIDFREQGLKVTIEFRDNRSKAMDGHATLVAAEAERTRAEILVKSSNVEPEPAANEEHDDSTDCESGDDQVRSSVTRPKTTPTALDFTPATSHPTIPTIKETPKHVAGTADEEAPFSTAPTIPVDDGDLPTADVNSPSVKAQAHRDAKSQERKDESQAQASAKLMSTVAATPSEDMDDDLINFTPKRGNKTYGRDRGRRSKRETAAQSPTADEDVQLPDTDPMDAPPDGWQEPELMAGESDIPPTSEPLNSHGVAAEVASRTTSQSWSKRKLSAEADEGAADESEGEASNKKRKIETDADTIATDELSDTIEQDESSETLAPPSSATRGKLNKAARGKAGSTASKNSAPTTTPTQRSMRQLKSSPEVVIRSQQRATQTPSSSTLQHSLASHQRF